MKAAFGRLLSFIGAAMKQDLDAEIAKFPPEHREEIRSVLRRSLGDPNEEAGNHLHVLRCVVFLSQGDMTRYRSYSEQAARDPSSVTILAEYDEVERHVRDLNQPYDGDREALFPQEKPFQFPIWAAYLLAPIFFILFALRALWNMANPWPIVLMAVGSGLLCAAALHGYIYLKSVIRR